MNTMNKAESILETTMTMRFSDVGNCPNSVNHYWSLRSLTPPLPFTQAAALALTCFFVPTASRVPVASLISTSITDPSARQKMTAGKLRDKIHGVIVSE